MRVLVFGVLLGMVALPAAAVPAAKRSARAGGAMKTPARSAAQSQAVVKQLLDGIVTSVWTHADYYWHEGRYEDHVAICRFMMQADPAFPESYSSGGWLLENLGRKEDALAVYLEGVRAVPNDWRPLHDLGYYYFKQKRYPEAVETLEKAVGFKPPAFVWHVLAHGYEKSGNVARSIATWRHCLEMDPDDGAAGHNLRRLEGRRDAESAEAAGAVEAN